MISRDELISRDDLLRSRPAPMTTGRPKLGARAPGPLSETYPPFPSTAASRPHTHSLTPTPTRAGCPPASLPSLACYASSDGGGGGHYTTPLRLRCERLQLFRPR